MKRYDGGAFSRVHPSKWKNRPEAVRLVVQPDDAYSRTVAELSLRYAAPSSVSVK